LKISTIFLNGLSAHWANVAFVSPVRDALKVEHMLTATSKL
jgi:hypothetical protein